MAEGSIRARGPGAWEIKFDITRDPGTGKRRSKTETVRGNKRDAQRVLRQRLDALDKGTFADAGKVTLGQWLTEWLSQAKHTTSPKTHERYGEIVNGHLIPNLGALPLAKLSAASIQSFYTKCLTSGRLDGKGGLSAQTVRHFDRVLNVALKRARALRLIAYNPVEDVEKPRVEREEMKVLDAAQATALLAAARTTRLHAMIFVALGTGLRRGELLGLRWSDLNLAKASLTVAQTLETTKDGLRFKGPKTKRGNRTIALSASVVETLKAHRATQAVERLQLGLGRPSDLLVFTRLDGEPMQPDNTTKEFVRKAYPRYSGATRFSDVARSSR
jgi:integrase